MEPEGLVVQFFLGLRIGGLEDLETPVEQEAVVVVGANPTANVVSGL
jgi:hypothetical protein